MKKGFIFSLDAFAALSLISLALYTLIFFFAYPKIYLVYLLHAHTLAKETLISANQWIVWSEGHQNITALGKILYEYYTFPLQKDYLSYTDQYIGSRIPLQYGYKLELYSNDFGWVTLYDTSDVHKRVPNDQHNALIRKFSASATALLPVIYFSETKGENPYGYLFPVTCEGCYSTCSGSSTPCDVPVSTYEAADATVGLVRLTLFT
ncbi:MAG: hypothetical protein QW035_04225 [Candidatus Anstonellales archaeon]